MLCQMLQWLARRCKKPSLTILLTHSKGGVTITGEIMDITLHIGHREFFQLSGKDVDGDVLPLTGGTLIENSQDPQIATITTNPNNASMIAVDGIAVGSTTATVDFTNEDGVKAQTTTLNITVLAEDITEVDLTQVGGEVTSDTPFPSD